MHCRPISTVSISAACAFALAALAGAQADYDRPVLPLDAIPGAEPSSPVEADQLSRAPFDELMFDTSPDGALWVRSDVYKARFDGASATFVPFFGPGAPRNFPLELRASSATLDGQALAVGPAARARLDGRTVRIERGAFVEEYDLTATSLEQCFVFDELDRRGELAVRLALDSELVAVDLGATLSFANELGRIDYGQAYALDASGARIELDSTLIDGAIELRVPADFVAKATLPLVIDPLITFYTAAGSTRAEIYPDVAYDASTDRWCLTWADIWSAADHDLYARLATGSYQLLTTLTIDFTSDYWTTPKVANNNASNVFLIVAAWDPPGTTSRIGGRIVNPSSATAGAVFQISAADTTERYWPDVGGDPYPAAPSYFCVVWQRDISANNVDIEGVLVSPTGALAGSVIPLENGAGRHEHPYISSSLGLGIGDGLDAWTVTWQYQYSPSDRDIYGARISWGGSVVNTVFPIQTSTWDETEPMAAMLLDAPVGTQRPYLVVYERDYGSDHDVIASVVNGSTVLANVNLVGGFDSSVWYYDQRIPAVDSDGQQFMVAFVEYATGSSDGNVWGSGYYWNGTQLVACEQRSNIAGSGQLETDVAIHSMGASGGARDRFLAAYTFGAINTSYDVVGALWDGCGNGIVSSSCAEPGIACPCGNNGAAGRGCANSANASGALLTHSGNASLANDTLVLSASGLPANVTCLFFETASFNAAGVVLGDGIRCASGAAYRLPLKQASGGNASYPQAGDADISVLTGVPYAGATRYYQAWYRDPQSPCANADYNLTNALQVTWGP